MRNLITKYYALFPTGGMVLYLVLFTAAASRYPGGSENLPYANGYSFFHNFLCDTMNEVTHGGQVNQAIGLAIIAHLVLSFTMVSFFFILPEIFPWSNSSTRMIRYAGMFTMLVFAFMYTDYHDHIVTATGVFGSIALLPFFVELRKVPDSPLKRLAYVCFGMSLVVFFIFQTKLGYYYLPFLQKITFVLDATWVVWVSLLVHQKGHLAQRKVVSSV